MYNRTVYVHHNCTISFLLVSSFKVWQFILQRLRAIMHNLSKKGKKGGYVKVHKSKKRCLLIQHLGCLKAALNCHHIKQKSLNCYNSAVLLRLFKFHEYIFTHIYIYHFRFLFILNIHFQIIIQTSAPSDSDLDYISVYQ